MSNTNVTFYIITVSTKKWWDELEITRIYLPEANNEQNDHKLLFVFPPVIMMVSFFFCH